MSESFMTPNERVMMAGMLSKEYEQLAPDEVALFLRLQLRLFGLARAASDANETMEGE